MKKLLSLLASLGLTAVAGLGVVACTVTIPSSAVSVDPSGIATFSAKLYIDKDTTATVSGNTIKYDESKFAILPDGNYKQGDKLNGAMEIKEITSYADSLTTNKIRDGKMIQGSNVKATIKFKVSQPEGQNKFKVALVKTNDQKVSSFVEYIEIKLGGSISNPGISNATLKDDKTITVSVQDIKATGDVKDKVTIDKITDIKSATIEGNTLTIKLTNAIAKSYEEQTFKITYKDETKEYSTNLTVPGVAKPAFSSASYDGKTTVTINGSNLDNFLQNFDSSKLSIADKDGKAITISGATEADNKISATIDAIAKTYDDQTFTVAYKDDANKLDLSTSFTIAKMGTPTFTGASYEDGSTTVKVSGSNLTDWITPLTPSDVSITSGDVTATVSAVTPANDNEIDITLANPIAKTLVDQTFTVKINGEDAGTFKVAPKAAPKFTKAEYAADTKTITITGTDFDNFDPAFSKDKLTVDGNTIADASVKDNKITATVSDSFKEFKDSKSYKVSYKDGVIDTNVSFNIGGSTLDKTAKYDDTKGTITMTGTNLGVNADVKDKVSGIADVKSATTTDTSLVITLNKPIEKTISDQNFTVTYTLTGDGTAFTAPFTVSKDTSLNPTWASAKLDGEKIVITGTHLDQIKDWSALTVTGLPNGIKATNPKAATSATELDITLSGEVKPTNNDITITVAYKGNGLDLNTTVTVVKGTPKVDKTTGNSITGTATSTTITVTGEYLSQVTKDDIKLSGTDKTGRLALGDINITDTQITIAVGGASWEANGSYKISLGHELSDITLAVNLDEPAAQVTAGQTFSLDKDGTITVNGNYLDQVKTVTVDPTSKITVSVKTPELTKLTLSVSGLTYENNGTYKIKIGTATVSLTTNVAYPAAQVTAGQKFTLNDNGSIAVKGKYLKNITKSDVSIANANGITIGDVKATDDTVTINLSGLTYDNNGTYTITVKGVTVSLTTTVAEPAPVVTVGQTASLTADGSFDVTGKYMNTITKSDVSIDGDAKGLSISDVKADKDKVTISVTGLKLDNNGTYTVKVKGVDVTLTTNVAVTKYVLANAATWDQSKETITVGITTVGNASADLLNKVIDKVNLSIGNGQVGNKFDSVSISGSNMVFALSTIGKNTVNNNANVFKLVIKDNPYIADVESEIPAPAPTDNSKLWLVSGNISTDDLQTVTITVSDNLVKPVTADDIKISGATTDGINGVAVTDVSAAAGQKTITFKLAAALVAGTDTGITVTISGFKDGGNSLDVTASNADTFIVKLN